MTMYDSVKDAAWHKKLKALRALKGWSQDEAAKECGTNQKVYWDWEQGNRYPRFNNRKAIAMAFGVPVEEIFGKKSEVS